jgi:hypothetical protein
VLNSVSVSGTAPWGQKETFATATGLILCEVGNYSMKRDENCVLYSYNKYSYIDEVLY